MRHPEGTRLMFMLHSLGGSSVSFEGEGRGKSIKLIGKTVQILITEPDFSGHLPLRREAEAKLL